VQGNQKRHELSDIIKLMKDTKRETYRACAETVEKYIRSSFRDSNLPLSDEDRRIQEQVIQHLRNIAKLFTEHGL